MSRDSSPSMPGDKPLDVDDLLNKLAAEYEVGTPVPVDLDEIGVTVHGQLWMFQ